MASGTYNPFGQIQNGDYVAVGQSVPEVSYPPLAEALDTLEDRIQVLHSRLEVLASRLSPVLAPQPPLGADTSNCKAQQVHSEVVMQIRGRADRIDNAVAIVESLLRRCEV